MKKTAQGKEETHMTELLKLPVGIENFEEIRRDNFYYIEVKYAESGHEEEMVQKALRQIQDKDYGYEFRQEGIRRILYYGIACNKKVCRAEVLEV